jgi:hypothetical protein
MFYQDRSSWQEGGGAHVRRMIVNAPDEIAVAHHGKKISQRLPLRSQLAAGILAR